MAIRSQKVSVIQGQGHLICLPIENYAIVLNNLWSKFHHDIQPATGLQIYGGPRSLSHDFKIWPITFQGSGPILFSCEKISL